MNNYAILRRNKLKSTKELGDAYKHNERIYDVANANPLLKDQNIELVDTMGRSYEELYEDTIIRLEAEGSIDRTIRADAVKGFEIFMGYSRERTDIDVEKWARENIKWLDTAFNPPDHKAVFIDKHTGLEKTIEVQNIKHAVLHMDESNPHIHAFIVPIDDKGHLNAKYFFSGRDQMLQLQTDYAKAMSAFGLDRGTYKSIAYHENISRFYTYLLEAVNAKMPEPKEHESVQEYKTRIDEIYQRTLSNHRVEILKKDQEIDSLRPVEQQMKWLCQAVEEPFLDDERCREIVTTVKKQKAFKEAVKNYPDRNEAEKIAAEYSKMVEWQLSQEREKDIEERTQ